MSSLRRVRVPGSASSGDAPSSPTPTVPWVVNLGCITPSASTKKRPPLPVISVDPPVRRFQRLGHRVQRLRRLGVGDTFRGALPLVAIPHQTTPLRTNRRSPAPRSAVAPVASVRRASMSRANAHLLVTDLLHLACLDLERSNGLRRSDVSPPRSRVAAASTRHPETPRAVRRIRRCVATVPVSRGAVHLVLQRRLRSGGLHRMLGGRSSAASPIVDLGLPRVVPEPRSTAAFCTSNRAATSATCGSAAPRIWVVLTLASVEIFGRGRTDIDRRWRGVGTGRRTRRLGRQVVGDRQVDEVGVTETGCR